MASIYLHLDLEAVMQVADQKEQVGCGPRPPSLPCHQQRWLVPTVLSLHGANNMWMGPP